jgi:hypothetical protein
MKVIAYGTPEFNTFIKNVKISPQEAWDIQLEYYKNNKMKTIGVPLFFIINDKYLFTPYYNPKIPEVTIKGVAVDSKTGFAEYINKKIKIKPKSQFGWRGDDK